MTDTKHATIRYTGMRIGVFVACLALVTGLAHLGLIPLGIGDSNPLWLFALAILISSPISFVLLNRQRDAMSQQVGDAVLRTRDKLHSNRTMEDEADDAARGAAAEKPATEEPAATTKDTTKATTKAATER
ncbi:MULTISPECIES: DUF4229 domain-containing protein [unclassified Streptomyces]|uniref:DUF4229 domain-containing protein n=1 Tax=unclassified Streptomyces TaxID=2593676 RepID=UPI00215623A5|nr:MULTISPECIES: DUF4229 domain-containing protein [unclassified Streptomyces]